MSITHAPPTHAGRLHVNVWVVAVIALAAALVALGAWVLVDRTTSSPTPERASPEVVAMLEARLAALNSADAEALSTFFTRDAVMSDVLAGSPSAPGPVVSGNEEIGRYIAEVVSTFGMQLQSVPPIIQYGHTVVEPVAIRGSEEEILLVYRLAPNGKISYEWVLPAGNEVTDFG